MDSGTLLGGTLEERIGPAQSQSSAQLKKLVNNVGTGLCGTGYVLVLTAMCPPAGLYMMYQCAKQGYNMITNHRQ